MKMKLMYCVPVIAALMTLPAPQAHAAEAQDYPSQPIHLMAGSPAGSSVDVLARVFAEKLASSLGQPVVVENRVGATGTIATAALAKSSPDGYRILLQHSGAFTNSVLNKNVQYDILKDFTPIAFATISPLVLIAGPSFKANSVKEVIEAARAEPGKVTYGSEGTGGTSHVATELFSQLADIRMTHVPYKSGFYSSTAVASGEIDMAFASLTTVQPLLKTGKYRALAVGTQERSANLPDVPTVAEGGVQGFYQAAWFGFVGPAGMDAAVVDKLYKAIADASKHPDVIENLKTQGMEVQLKSPDEFGRFMNDFAKEISEVAKKSEITLN